MPAPIAIRLHPNDNVVVARMDILPNTKVEGEVSAATRVPPGHKILTRAVKKDAVLTYDDVELPADRVADRLRARQYRHFRNETWLEERLG